MRTDKQTQLRDALRDHGALGPLFSVGLILLPAVVLLPADLLVLANGMASGF